MSTAFKIKYKPAFKEFELSLGLLKKVAPKAMSKGMYFFLGEFQKEQLNIKDGKVAAYGGKRTSPRSSKFGLRNVSGSLNRSWHIKSGRTGSGFVVKLATDSKYARIHQYGGTIQHPGGTPYITLPDKSGEWRFIPLSANKQYSASVMNRIKFTKPHAIKIPKRLYLIERFRSRGNTIIMREIVKAAQAIKRGR